MVHKIILHEDQENYSETRGSRFMHHAIGSPRQRPFDSETTKAKLRPQQDGRPSLRTDPQRLFASQPRGASCWHPRGTSVQGFLSRTPCPSGGCRHSFRGDRRRYIVPLSGPASPGRSISRSQRCNELGVLAARCKLSELRRRTYDGHERMTPKLILAYGLTATSLRL